MSSVDPTSRPDIRARGWILVAAVLASSMAFIDGTVVNVALPALQNAFAASGSAVQWIVESYALMLAALLLVGGAAGDVYGHRPVFASGVALFAVASAACGISQTVHQLIAARALQGVGAALLVPGSLSLITTSFPESERGSAIGTWSAWTAITTAGGPLLGGWFVQHASWRWVFFLNLPLAGAVLAILFLRVPATPHIRSRNSLDWVGAFLAAFSLGTIVLGLIEFHRGTLFVALTISSGAAALLAFLWWESHTQNPMVPLELFRSRAFTAANVLTLLLYFGLSGIFFFLPLNLIQVQGLSPTQAGASMLPFAVLMFLLSRWSGSLVTRFGARLPLLAGSLITSAGFALFAVPGVHASFARAFLPAILVTGFGLTMIVAPLTTVVMNSTGAEHSGAASGVNNAVSRIAGLLAIAMLGVVLSAVFDRTLPSELSRGQVSAAESAHILDARQRLAATPTNTPQGKAAVQQSFVAGYRVVVVFAAVLCLISTGLSLALLPRKPGA